MNFKPFNQFFLYSLCVFLLACSDPENETNLINLHATASLDIISIDFNADTTESIVSINAEYDFELQGLKSNGIDLISVTEDAQWSLSEGALSTIDQHGHLTAAASTEIITITAQLGYLVQSIEIKVSNAKFDQVVELDNFTIDMCQSQNIKPLGLYIDENGDEEIRSLDSIIINTINWTILNQEDNTASIRAHIETLDNQSILRSLSAGDIIIQAQATSVYTGNAVTSADFNQSIDNGLTEIKICSDSDTDLSSCNITSTRVEKDTTTSLIAVATYQDSNNTDYNENITNNSAWGINNSANASIALADDHMAIDVTGLVEVSTANLSVACGAIDQSLAAIDITQGITLNEAVSCDTDIYCLTATATITIDKLSATSLEVSANDIDLTHDESITLTTRPEEISLIVTANFSNSSDAIVTDDVALVYGIITEAGELNVIEKITDSPGTFTVLRSGTAKIQLTYSGTESFIVLIVIP